MLKFILILFPFLCLSCATKKTFNATLDGYSYPYEVSYYEFESQRQSLKMAYMDLNNKSNKAIVLLHGKNFAGFYWEKIADILVEKGYRVIIPDQIGFGKSSKPERYQFSFYNMAHQTNNLLNSLGIQKYDIIGHSMGGMLATHMAYAFESLVSKVILINPIGLEPYLKYVEYKDADFFYRNELSKTPEKFKNYQMKNYYDGKWDKSYDYLLEPYNLQMQGSDFEKVAWNNALTYGPIFSEDITRIFPELKQKVYLIIGDRDKTGPGRFWKKDKYKDYKLGEYKRLAKLAKKNIKNSELYLLKDLGHMPQFEDFDAFKKVFNKVVK